MNNHFPVPPLDLQPRQPPRTASEASQTDIEVSSSPGSIGKGGNALSRPATPTQGDAIRFQTQGEYKPASGALERTASNEDLLTMDEFLLKGLSSADLEEDTSPKPAIRIEPAVEDAALEHRKTDSPRAMNLKSFMSSWSLKQSADRQKTREPSSPRIIAISRGTSKVAMDPTTPLKALSLRASDTGPITTRFTEWDDMSAEHPQARYEPTDAAEISQRSSLLDNLFLALEKGDFGQVKDRLAAIPDEVQHLDRYFPPAPLALDYNALLRRAEILDKATPRPSIQRLLKFVQDCKLRSEAQKQVSNDHAHVADAQLSKIYPTEVHELCVALRDASDAELNARPSPFLKRIVFAMANQRLMAALATQPYVNLRMLQLKCTVLAEQIDPKLANGLLEKIQEARDLQKDGSVLLREHLLESPMFATNVAALALVEYAKQMTSLPIDHVSAGATWHEVLALKHGMQSTYEHYLAMPAGTADPEVVALRWVTAQISSTQRLQSPRKN